MRTTRCWMGIAVALIGVLSAAACGDGSEGDAAAGASTASDPGSDSPGDSTATTDSPDASFPVTIEHAFGATTIDEPPERIVTLGEDLDTLAALGVVPVGYAPTAPGYSDDVPYLEGRIDLSGSEVLEVTAAGAFNIEQIAALRPDLILGSNLYTMGDHYDTLSEIAPTVGYETAWGETSWQDMAITIGQAVGDEAGARAAVAETERYLADLRRELPGLEGKTVAGAYHYATGEFAINPHAASMDKFLALGMHVPQTLLDAIPPGGAQNTISMEQLGLLDVDFLMLSFDTAELAEALQNHPLYQQLDVVKAGNVAVMASDDVLSRWAGNNPTLLNIPWLLDNLEPALAKVAGGGR